MPEWNLWGGAGVWHPSGMRYGAVSFTGGAPAATAGWDPAGIGHHG